MSEQTWGWAGRRWEGYGNAVARVFYGLTPVPRCPQNTGDCGPQVSRSSRGLFNNAHSLEIMTPWVLPRDQESACWKCFPEGSYTQPGLCPRSVITLRERLKEHFAVSHNPWLAWPYCWKPRQWDQHLLSACSDTQLPRLSREHKTCKVSCRHAIWDPCATTVSKSMNGLGRQPHR